MVTKQKCLYLIMHSIVVPLASCKSIEPSLFSLPLSLSVYVLLNYSCYLQVTIFFFSIHHTILLKAASCNAGNIFHSDPFSAELYYFQLVKIASTGTEWPGQGGVRLLLVFAFRISHFSLLLIELSLVYLGSCREMLNCAKISQCM